MTAMSNRLRPLLRHVLSERTGEQHGALQPSGLVDEKPSAASSVPVAAEQDLPAAPVDPLLKQRFPGFNPLSMFAAPGEQPRVTLVLDGRDLDLLSCQPNPALALLSQLAEQRGAHARVVTRRRKLDSRHFRTSTAACSLRWPTEVELVHADVEEDTAIDLLANELFITTCCETTWSVQQSVAEQRIVYLLSEDERLRYPSGEEQLRCSTALRSPSVRFVVASRCLFEHFVKEGFDSIREHGTWFEPAFPPSRYHPEQPRSGRKAFLFFARPDEPSSLYRRGLSVLEQAFACGAIDPQEWELYFVGKDLTPPRHPFPIAPVLVQDPDGPAYASLLRRTHAGLVLRDAPAPSLAALELAACGAQVVTNRYGDDKQQQHENLLYRDLDVGDLVSGVAEAVQRAGDLSRSRASLPDSPFARDWRSALAPVLQLLAEE